MLEAKLRELVELLVNTEEFSVLKLARANLEKNVAAGTRVEQYFRDAASRPSGGPKHEEAGRQFEQLMLVPEIAAYFTAGRKFERMMLEIHHRLNWMIDRELTGRKG